MWKITNFKSGMLKKKKVSPRNQFIFCFPEGFWRIFHNAPVNVSIMCRAAVKKVECAFTASHHFFFLQPSGKQYSKFQKQRICVCVCVYICACRQKAGCHFPPCMSRTWSVRTSQSPSDCNCAVFAELGWGISRVYINL